MKRIAALCLVATVGAAVGLVSPAAEAASPTISVTQHGAAKPWEGKYYWVLYPGHGRITGTVSSGATGTNVVLHASTFPFRHGYSRIAHTTTGNGGRFSFRIHPTFATHYRVTSAGATSRVMTFYVQGRSRTFSQSLCPNGGTTCHANASYAQWFPASIGKREVGLRSYSYIGVNRASSPPPPPKVLRRSTSYKLTHKRVSRTKWDFHVTFSFRPGSQYWYVQWLTCSRENEPAVGFGLPVHTGCGNKSVPNDPARLKVIG